MKRHHIACLFSVLISSAQGAELPSSSAQIISCRPLAVQVGQSSTHTVNARPDARGAYQVIVSGRGVSGEALPEKSKKPSPAQVEVRFVAEADALPGMREFRIVTPHGASTLGTIVVVRDPVVVAKDKGNTLADATPVEWPVAVCGSLPKGRWDYFRFHVSRGTSLVFHVTSARCLTRIHDLKGLLEVGDPTITLFDSQGMPLATNDNYFAADPLLHHTFAAAGDYYLGIRDVRYLGYTYWPYVIEITDRPWLSNVFPLAVAPGAPTSVELAGFNLPAKNNAVVVTSPNLAEGLHWHKLTCEGGETNPAPIVVSWLPLMMEAAQHDSPQTAQLLAELPVGVNGRLAAPGEIDYYAFDAKKGESFTIEVVARRHQSAADPIVTISNERGSQLLEADDMVVVANSKGRYLNPDVLIENWTAPASGRHTIEMRDLQWQGGPGFVYFLTVARAQPDFTLELDGDKATVIPGCGTPLFVHANRRNGFTGEIQLSIEGLPPGVRARCGRILLGSGTKNLDDGCIVLEADEQAKLGAANVRVTGTSITAEGPAVIARPWQEVRLNGDNRALYPVQMATVAIAEPAAVSSMKLSHSEIRLRPGESQEVAVTISRAPGFNGIVTLDCLFHEPQGSAIANGLPPGVTIDVKKSKLALSKDQTVGAIWLVAAKDARPVEAHVVPVMAQVSLDLIHKLTYAQPLLLTVAP